jgi:hypothetical protein
MMERAALLLPMVMCLIEESCEQLSLIDELIHAGKQDSLRQERSCFAKVPCLTCKAS